MQLNEKAIANSLALVSAGFYLICVILTLLVPDLFLSFFKSWVHGVDITQIWAPSAEPLSIVWGLISFTLVSWLTGYAFAKAYKYFVKSK